MNAPAGPVLALDTSTTVGSAAVGIGQTLLAEVVVNVGAGHSSALLPAIDHVMHSAGFAPRDLQGVVVGGGPGSFTGLRVAAATAKGIVHALGVPLFAYSGLLAIAAGCVSAGRPVCALLDARRRDVFVSCYSFREEIQEIFAPQALPLDVVLERFRSETPIFAGEGAVLHADEIRRELAATVAPDFLAFPRASVLLWLLSHAPERGRIADPAGWEPEYLRASGAERIAAGGARP